MHFFLHLYIQQYFYCMSQLRATPYLSNCMPIQKAVLWESIQKYHNIEDGAAYTNYYRWIGVKLIQISNTHGNQWLINKPAQVFLLLFLGSSKNDRGLLKHKTTPCSLEKNSYVPHTIWYYHYLFITFKGICII